MLTLVGGGVTLADWANEGNGQCLGSEVEHIVFHIRRYSLCARKPEHGSSTITFCVRPQLSSARRERKLELWSLHLCVERHHSSSRTGNGVGSLRDNAGGG